MQHRTIALSLAALALGAAACGNPESRMRPEVPSDVTATTSTPAPPSPAIEASPPTADTPVGSTTLTSSPPLEAPSRSARHATPAFTDAEIAAILDAADRAERQLAREGSKHAQSARARQLAQRILSDHGEAKLERVERTSSLSPSENATSAELKSRAAVATQRLEGASDHDFDRALVDSLEDEERRLAQLLDDQLIPQAQNAELRTLLQEIRMSLSSRIGMAEEARSSRAR